MPITAAITTLDYAGFVVAVVVLLIGDLLWFHRRPKEVSFQEALWGTLFWVLLATAFGIGFIYPKLGHEDTLEFALGYVIELSLSMDNVFVIALILGYFAVPTQHQHRVLFWGIIGAIVMRGSLIILGVAVVQQFHWVIYLLGALLVFSGIKLLVGHDEEMRMEDNSIVRAVRKCVPLTKDFHGAKFWVRERGRFCLTPLGLVLILVETTDLMFAFDSIPAIFGVSDDSFIIFTSNIFAVLGLRSLYFALSHAIAKFRYLKAGIAVIVVFVGARMLGQHFFQISTGTSLLVVGMVLATSLAVSNAVDRIRKSK